MPETAIVPAITRDLTATETWAEALWLPCQISVELPAPKFTVRDLLRLGEDTVIDLHWKQNADVPIRVNQQLIGYAEFEVIGEKSAVRITELV